MYDAEFKKKGFLTDDRPLTTLVTLPSASFGLRQGYGEIHPQGDARILTIRLQHHTLSYRLEPSSLPSFVKIYPLSREADELYPRMLVFLQEVERVHTGNGTYSFDEEEPLIPSLEGEPLFYAKNDQHERLGGLLARLEETLSKTPFQASLPPAYHLTTKRLPAGSLPGFEVRVDDQNARRVYFYTIHPARISQPSYQEGYLVTPADVDAHAQLSTLERLLEKTVWMMREK